MANPDSLAGHSDALRDRSGGSVPIEISSTVEKREYYMWDERVFLGGTPLLIFLMIGMTWFAKDELTPAAIFAVIIGWIGTATLIFAALSRQRGRIDEYGFTPTWRFLGPLRGNRPFSWNDVAKMKVVRRGQLVMGYAYMTWQGRFGMAYEIFSNMFERPDIAARIISEHASNRP